MKVTNTVADILNTGIVKIEVPGGVVPLPLNGKFEGEPGPPGAGVPAGGEPLQVVRKTASGSTTEWVTPTKSVVGLGNVDNTADEDKPLSKAATEALASKASTQSVALKADKADLDAKASVEDLLTVAGGKADLIEGKVPVSQLPEITPVTDSTIAPLINGATTGAAIDARINTQVAPQVEQLTANYIAGDRAVVDAAAAAVNAAPKIVQIEAEATKDRTRLVTLETDKWRRPVSSRTPGQNADTFTTLGFTGVLIATDAANFPISVSGSMEVFEYGSALTQRYTTYEADARQFVRMRGGNGVWGAWSETGKATINLATSTDLNTVVRPGSYAALSSSAPNNPAASLGSLEVLQVNRGLLQRFTAWSTSPQVFLRRADVDGIWGAWQAQPTADAVSAAIGKVDALRPSEGSGFKSAHLALNQPAGSSTEAVSAASVRWPVTLGITARRARLHLRNWNWSVGTGAGYNYTGAVSVSGLWAGPAQGKTFQGAPRRVLDAFTTPANGAEYVSEWFSYEFTEDVQHLVSIGFTTAAGQTNYQGRGGCWRTTNPADAGTVDPSAELSANSPFDVWLELEVPAATPVLAGFGDSNTVGTGTALPVHDSWLNEYCRKARAMPFFIANHGSMASSWAGLDAAKWNRFAVVAKPDAVVYFLHQNDLTAGITLDVLKQRYRDTVALLRAKLTQNVYAATVTPGNKGEVVESVRRAYNTWLMGRPEGVRDCFDFASAVSDDDTVLRPADAFDALHFNTAAHAKLAAKILERPATPRVMTAAEITRLVA